MFTNGCIVIISLVMCKERIVVRLGDETGAILSEKRQRAMFIDFKLEKYTGVILTSVKIRILSAQALS